MRRLQLKTDWGRILALLVVLTLTVGTLPLVTPAPAVAGGGQTFTVNNTDDENDGVCNADCSLADAIDAANDAQGTDTIAFNIPGDGPHQIVVAGATQLPTIEDPVIIDGYTEPGSKKNTLDKGTNAKIQILLTGNDQQTIGIVVNEGPTTIRGIQFGDHFICVQFNDNDGENVIEGNFFGNTEFPPRGCFFSGIQINEDSGNNRIGGTKPAQRNFMVLSGGGDDGIRTGGGIELFSDNNTVTGNAFGRKLPSEECGNEVVIISDFIFGNDNLVTKNEFCQYILAVSGGDRNKISRNTFIDTNIGIQLSGGANFNQASPVLDSAKTTGTTTTIKGTLNSTANTQFTIEFFSSPDDNDPAAKFIGKKNVTTNGSGDANITFKPKKKVPVGREVVATATDGDGNTSAFSAAEVVV